MTRTARTLGLGLLLLGSGCKDVTPPGPPPPPAINDAQLRQTITNAGVIPIGPVPPQNPALVDLGQALMFDKILSGNRDISCATCHHPSTHGADGLSLSIGTGGSGLGPSRTLGPGRQFVPRSAPSLLNQGLGFVYLFWDGRVTGWGSGPFRTTLDSVIPVSVPNILAAQAMLPVLNRREMRGERGDRDGFGNPNELAQFADSQPAAIWRGIMQRLLAIPDYGAKFGAAFPGISPNALGFQHAATAIAAFEIQAFTRTNSPLDRYLNREDAALSTEEKQGASLFFGRARCSSCHSGPMLGGQSFANDGVPQLGPGTAKSAPLDLGRAEVVRPQSGPPYEFAFRVPPLRNVELTAPYMHNGAYATLEALVRHYNNVPEALRTYDTLQLAPELRPTHHGDDATIKAMMTTLDFRLRTTLALSEQDQRQLVAFLKALTDPSARDLSSLVPASVPSGLPLQD